MPFPTGSNFASFGEALRHFRRKAEMQQEDLAECAGVSVYTISNLERGVAHAPHKDTVQLLARALNLSPDEMAIFTAAAPARTKPPASSPATDLQVVSMRTDLPSPITPLIGRESEIAELCALVAERDVRLITLSGPGGVGKTRLALACAHKVTQSFPDGARFISLAAESTLQGAIISITNALGVHEQGEQTPIDRLVDWLRDKQLLLVLDNLEQIAGIPHVLIDLLERCPRVRVLTTSRAPLTLRGEQLFEVAPLAVPSAAPALSFKEIAASPAVMLFVQRAHESRRDFHLDDANAATIAEICRHLDGLPLALELAAARIQMLTPATLLTRLESRLATLSSGYADSPARQQSLRAALDWSHDLLTPPAQRVFRRLAVFSGGCTLDAAVAVCTESGSSTSGGTESIDAANQREDVEAALLHLREQSLLQRLDLASSAVRPPAVRLYQLMTVREYALERLSASGEYETIAQTHALYFLHLAEAAETGLRGPEQPRWLERLAREYENLHTALGWLHEQQDIIHGLRLAGALWQFWAARGHFSDGRSWLERMIALADQHDPSASAANETESGDDWQPWLAKALNGAGVLATRQSNYAGALAFHERALELRRTQGDQPGIASSLNNIGGIAMEQAEYVHAQELWEESLALRRELGDPRAIALALSNLGALAHYRGENARAVTLLEEALALFRRVGDDLMRAMTLNNLGAACYQVGETAPGQRRVEESLALALRLGSRHDEGRALNNLAHMAYQQANNEEAKQRAEEGLTLHRELGDQWYQADDLALLGSIACDRGDFRRAEALLYEAFDLRQAIEHREGIADSLARFGALARAQGQWRRARDDFGDALLRYGEGNGVVGAARCLESLAGALLGVHGALHLETAMRLCGLAEALRHGQPALRPPSEQAYYERAVACGRAGLGVERYEAAWRAGAAQASRNLDDMVSELTRELERA